MIIARPKESEYDPFYKGYVNSVEEEDIIKVMEDQLEDFEDLILSLPFDGLGYSYARGKWSIAQVVGHMIDVERMMAFRAFSIARGEKQHLPAFDQDEYVINGFFDKRSKNSLLEEMEGLRVCNIKLIETFTEDILSREGVASGKTFTVRALVYIIPGHFQHHMNVLRNKYVSNA
ncbi:MAG: DinB family protein [Cyclobacteriaceae bacterium]